MPLIIITGIPSSGKSKRSLELKEYFETNRGKKVDIINEVDSIAKAGYDRNSYYDGECYFRSTQRKIHCVNWMKYFPDSKKEKSIRGDIKSEAQRRLNPNDILILDGSNYIKGYRYEIYCMSKLYKTPQCTIHCEIPVEHAWMLNEKRPEGERYTREIFDALVARWENKWEPDLDHVRRCSMLFVSRQVRSTG